MSYYRENQDGKNTAIFPGPMVLFWWWTRKVRWGDFVYVKGDGSKDVGARSVMVEGRSGEGVDEVQFVDGVDGVGCGVFARWDFG